MKQIGILAGMLGLGAFLIYGCAKEFNFPVESKYTYATELVQTEGEIIYPESSLGPRDGNPAMLNSANSRLTLAFDEPLRKTLTIWQDQSPISDRPYNCATAEVLAQDSQNEYLIGYLDGCFVGERTFNLEEIMQNDPNMRSIVINQKSAGTIGIDGIACSN